MFIDIWEEGFHGRRLLRAGLLLARRLLIRENGLGERAGVPFDNAPLGADWGHLPLGGLLLPAGDQVALLEHRPRAVAQPAEGLPRLAWQTKETKGAGAGHAAVRNDDERLIRREPLH